MRIAVVIPALHEADRIPEAIRSARAPDAAHGVDVEVVVADGGSRDGTRTAALEAGARVVDAAAGRARQLQAGADAVKEADVILFLHADTRLPPGWTAAVREALADPAVAGGAFTLGFDDSGPAMRLVAWGARWRARLLGLAYGDQALFVRRRVLDALGGVPQAPVMEDVDLVRSVRRRGRLVLRPERVTTSARRYREGGVARTVLRHAGALVAFALGLDRTWLARRVRR